MDDGMMRDPEYAKLHNQRPRHADFGKLSLLQQALDNTAENVPLDDTVAPIIDLDVLTYMAEQRTARLVGAIQSGEVMSGRLAFLTLYLDAFILGAMWGTAKANERARAPWHEQLESLLGSDEEGDDARG